MTSTHHSNVSMFLLLIDTKYINVDALDTSRGFVD